MEDSMSKINDDIRYIYWKREAETRIYYTPESWNAAVSELDADRRKNNITRVKTLRAMWVNGSWTANINQQCLNCEIYGEKDGKYFIMKHYNLNKMSREDKNESENEEPVIIEGKAAEDDGILTGGECRSLLKDKMKETNGKSFNARFGTLLHSNENKFPGSEFTQLDVVIAVHKINQTVGPFIANASLLQNQYHKGVNKADVSSAYPANAVNKTLPTWKDSKIVKGYVEPTEEYPFVFYLVSHHLAIYNELSTVDDIRHTLYKNYRPFEEKIITQYKKEKRSKPLPFINEEKEYSLCCKASEYNLDEFKWFYEQKSKTEGPEKQKMKDVMNKTIGTFDMIECPNYVYLPKRTPWGDYDSYEGHLRAVILARHNHNMMKYYDAIEAAGGEVVQVQTDSIMWKGPIPDCVSRKSELGALVLEIENGRAFIHGCGAYWIEDEHQHIEKHQSIANFPEGIETLEQFAEIFETAKTQNKKDVYIKRLVIDPNTCLIVEKGDN